jgi:hypothetical protein
MFAVDDIDDVVGRLRRHGAELIGDVVQYGDDYRLCYVRGPRASSSRWPSSSTEGWPEARVELGSDAPHRAVADR